MSAYETVKQAIIHRQQISAMYHGYRREMCPHVIGRKNGIQQALFYQFAGGSSSGLPLGGQWKCMVISKLSNVTAADGSWRSGASHTRPQTCVDDIDVEVSY